MQRVWEPGDPIPSERSSRPASAWGGHDPARPSQSLVTIGVVEIRHGEGSFIRYDLELLSDAFSGACLLSPRNVGRFYGVPRQRRDDLRGVAARARTQAIVDRLYELST